MSWYAALLTVNNYAVTPRFIFHSIRCNCCSSLLPRLLRQVLISAYLPDILGQLLVMWRQFKVVQNGVFRAFYNLPARHVKRSSLKEAMPPSLSDAWWSIRRSDLQLWRDVGVVCQQCRFVQLRRWIQASILYGDALSVHVWIIERLSFFLLEAYRPRLFEALCIAFIADITVHGTLALANLRLSRCVIFFHSGAHQHCSTAALQTASILRHVLSLPTRVKYGTLRSMCFPWTSLLS